MAYYRGVEPRPEAIPTSDLDTDHRFSEMATFLEWVVSTTSPSFCTAGPQCYSRPSNMAPRDWALFLLHCAAEIEHALMVQYLFAMFSLRNDSVLEDGTAVADWNATFRDIARQEMGHLLTVQNLLRLVGGAPCFEREDFPLRTAFYPFPFSLERFSKDSLAKYVFAEMASEAVAPEVISDSEREEICERATKDIDTKGKPFLNHVGTLYNSVHRSLDELKDRLYSNRDELQSLQWSGTSQNPAAMNLILLLPTSNYKLGIQAVEAIASQGESSTSSGSHFARFLEIYRKCPEDTQKHTWPVASNPSTSKDNSKTSLIIAKEGCLLGGALQLAVPHSAIFATTYNFGSEHGGFARRDKTALNIKQLDLR